MRICESETCGLTCNSEKVKESSLTVVEVSRRKKLGGLGKEGPLCKGVGFLGAVILASL